jgi:uncharacterized membrane protein
MTSEKQVPSQERVAGALAYIFFAIPMLMGTKTDFTMFHAKQSFMIFLAMIVVSVLSSILPWMFAWIISIIWLVVTVVVLWSLYQAYLGNKFVIPVIGEQMDVLLSKTNMMSLFSTK